MAKLIYLLFLLYSLSPIKATSNGVALDCDTVPDGVYFIQNYGTGTVLGLDDGSSANGTKVYGFQKRDLSDNLVPAQLWVVSQDENAVYTIENTNSRTYMDLPSSASETPIIGNQGTGDTSQQWTITRNTADIAYVVQNRATGTYIDLLAGSSADLTPVNGWAGFGVSTPNDNQLWEFVPA
ncbi:hypothetical protein FOMPIDRAFT_82402 [Fomitopsis schrenkii]|uniref:Ricin B lectin domain-containing protein n=1 Tax=Fomitopsis schrenkii TaxID=2126942 RepID=S8F7Y4_FOMSC|nr:hypothetical protein FOMPIDRAFT_82402 [Fomitopsis schrenkii]